MANSDSPMIRRRRRRARRRRIIVTTALLVLALGAGIGVNEAEASGTPGYRTALATTGNTTSDLTISGTVEPVNEAQASFQVAGTVSAVEVTQGQHVTAGQTLATVDATALQEQVSLAQASLTSAQAKLSADESGQSSTSTSGTGSSTTQTGGQAQTAAATTAAIGPSNVELTVATVSHVKAPTGSRTGGGTGTSASSTTNLKQAQQAVVSAQHTVDLDMQTTVVTLASAEHTCATSGGSRPTGPTSTSNPSTTTTSTTTPSSSTTSTTTSGSTPTTAPSTTTPTSTPSPSSSNACASALQQAMNSEQQVSRDQQAVQSAETTLAQILTATAASMNQKSIPSPGPSSGNTSSKGLTTPTGTKTTPTTAATNSAAQLASDQASIDSDQATLVSAEQAINNAKLSSPIAGTVATVNITPGQTVSAGSSSNTITITDPGSYQTTSSLTSSQVRQVAVGDSVQISIDGQTNISSGTVSRVGPVQGSSSSYSYPLVVSLEPGAITAGTTVAGSSAQLTVELSHAGNTVVVPTSAVHTTSAGDSYVTILQSGRPIRKTVKVGVVGQIYTQIRSGLSPGSRVVLADPSQAVPSSSNNSTSSFRGFAGTGGLPTGPPSGFVRTGSGG